ncbi:MAG TPA: hypothetical protein PLI45_00015 [Candidatus Woesebacteria bacterium]|nr:hypothetical protein [Candidatus Woesebacteria bacterium]
METVGLMFFISLILGFIFTVTAISMSAHSPNPTKSTKLKVKIRNIFFTIVAILAFIFDMATIFLFLVSPT